MGSPHWLARVDSPQRNGSASVSLAWVIGAATLVALAAAVAIIASTRGAVCRIHRLDHRGVAALAMLAIVWEALPAIMVPPCV